MAITGRCTFPELASLETRIGDYASSENKAGILRLVMRAQLPTCEISSRVRTQEKPGNYREDHGMHGDLAKNREADRYVEGHPDKREPACPVMTQEHKDSCKDGQRFREFYPHSVLPIGHQFGKVISEADDPDRNVQAGENQY